MRRTGQRFDAIILGFVDSWAAIASGGLSLAENHLYTVEAFRDYYERLSPDGVLAILRWSVDAPRLVANAAALLGGPEAGRRIAVLIEARGSGESPPQMIFLLKKRPFSGHELDRLAGRPGVRPVVLPGRHTEEPYASLFAGRATLEEYVARWPTKADPVYDDRPFFFARDRPWGIPPSMALGLGGIVVPVVLLCGVMLSRGRPPAAATRRYVGAAAYFASLGMGFIAVELALLHHLTLLLGHPTFTMSILLFTLLAAGGLGSAWPGRVRLAPVCLLVAGLGGLYALCLGRLVPALLDLPFGVRVVTAVVLLAPLGFAMGMPFPRALARTGEGPLPAPPFYWGLNGVFSVIGSVATMLVAVVLGFTWAMFAGAACYLAAAGLASSVEPPAAGRT
jgi:hypothetical protein